MNVDILCVFLKVYIQYLHCETEKYDTNIKLCNVIFAVIALL